MKYLLTLIFIILPVSSASAGGEDFIAASVSGGCKLVPEQSVSKGVLCKMGVVNFYGLRCGPHITYKDYVIHRKDSSSPWRRITKKRLLPGGCLPYLDRHIFRRIRVKKSGQYSYVLETLRKSKRFKYGAYQSVEYTGISEFDELREECVSLRLDEKVVGIPWINKDDICRPFSINLLD